MISDYTYDGPDELYDIILQFINKVNNNSEMKWNYDDNVYIYLKDKNKIHFNSHLFKGIPTYNNFYYKCILLDNIYKYLNDEIDIIDL